MSKKVVYEGTSTFTKWEGDYLTDEKTGDFLFLCLPQCIRFTSADDDEIDWSIKRLRVTIEELNDKEKGFSRIRRLFRRKQRV